MALKISLSQLTAATGLEVVADNGEPGILDPGDLLRTPDGKNVQWEDAELQRARHEFVHKHLVVPTAKQLDALTAGLKPGQKSPTYEADKPRTLEMIASATAIAEDTSLPVEVRSDALLLVSALKGYIANNENSRRMGKESFSTLNRAHATAPEHARALGTLGAVLLSMSRQSFIKRAAMESAAGLNINIQTELRTVLDKLSRLPKDLEAQAYLGILLDELDKEGKANVVDSALRGTVSGRLQEWRKDPAKRKTIDDIQSGVRKQVNRS